MIAAALQKNMLALDSVAIRRDFPALSQRIHGQPLTYLDSGASALKPRAVIDAIANFYATDYANVHRGVHTLSVRATDAFEGARAAVADFINARTANEIIFTRNATESLNLIAATLGRSELKPGDEVLITELEHHANIVPWQLLAKERGIKLKIAKITDAGAVTTAAIQDAITPRTRLISVAHVSNALGTILPVKEIAALARAQGAFFILDGCQAVSHQRVDMQSLGCDFYVFSGHKLYGPSGIGVLWGREEILNRLPPYQGGGDMISTVSFTESTFKPAPHRFEAGTPAIAEAVGLAAAIRYLETIGLDRIAAHENDLLAYATRELSAISALRLVGTAPEKSAILSFVLKDVHPHDVGTVLDHAGIAVRAGHHCAQPVMERLSVPATVRASLGLYNTREDIDRLVVALHKTLAMFAR